MSHCNRISKGSQSNFLTYISTTKYFICFLAPTFYVATLACRAEKLRGRWQSLTILGWEPVGVVACFSKVAFFVLIPVAKPKSPLFSSFSVWKGSFWWPSGRRSESIFAPKELSEVTGKKVRFFKTHLEKWQFQRCGGSFFTKIRLFIFSQFYLPFI